MGLVAKQRSIMIGRRVRNNSVLFGRNVQIRSVESGHLVGVNLVRNRLVIPCGFSGKVWSSRFVP